MKFLLIFLGGGFGSVIRYAVSKYLNNADNCIPYGTLLVNIIGSFIIGTVIGLSLKDGIDNNQTLFFAVGFAGGFTTFSTFAFENATLIEDGNYVHLALYISASIILGVAAVFLGLSMAK